MIDIWGRSISALKKPTTETQTFDLSNIKKIIEDEVAETLNLASVDPNEIVVFQDKQGKLKTSNISLDDILTRRRDAIEDTIALYSDNGKLKPGVLISSITDKLSTVDTTETSLKSLKDKYDNHITEFTTFSELYKTIVDKIDKPILEFFGNPPTTTPKLTEIKASMLELTTLQSQYTDHVKQFTGFRKNIIDKFLGVTPDKLEIKLPELKKSIEDTKKVIDAIKVDLPRMVERLDKVKIPHDSNNNLVYTIQHGSFTWTPTTNKLNLTATVKGIYRLTLVSPLQFNISSLSSSGVNNVISTIINKGTTETFTITSTDANLTNAPITWYWEFVVDLSKQLN